VHRSGYNLLFEGTKTWYLMRPEHSYTTNLHVKRWLAETAAGELSRNHSHVLQCTQHAGDVMFVPRDWGHATLIDEDVFGFACEIENQLPEIEVVQQ